jgi:CHAT domain-containing protein
MGTLLAVQGNWAEAATLLRRAADIAIAQSKRTALGRPLTGAAVGEAARPGEKLTLLVKILGRLASTNEKRNAAVTEMFVAGQRARGSQAATSIGQMAARQAGKNPILARTVRERQDLSSEWQSRDKLLIAALSRPPEKRNAAAETTLRDRLAAIDRRIAEIDGALGTDFPEYASLSNPEPLSIGEAQAQLRPDEALVFILDTPELTPAPEETFIWVVTKTDARWVKSELGTLALTREVAALRCGLDYDGAWGTPSSRCADLIKASYSLTDRWGGKLLPFDRDRAHGLYKALFGQIGDVIKDKHLLIVPSGALTQLPFQVLVTEKSDTAGRDDVFRRSAWLIRQHALTILPAVSSLKALRQLAKDSHADRTMIGFGNPLLDGPDARFAKSASAARSKQSCPKTPKQRVAALTGERRGVLPLDLRRGLAEVTEIRGQVPLPETADELCAVARDLRVNGDEIRLGARATESEIKRLSEAGELSKYRLIHFATHGALAGQVSGNSEPGLLLTPPDKATEADDGYLSASEIAALKLDADWVILSACNTAAGGVEGAEALSGLARAFFYAGARALLVSHWAVDSDATVKLITGAVNRMAADKSVGRADAMRQSMLALIDKGKAYEAHPSYWAPFVVVGEGAAAK